MFDRDAFRLAQEMNAETAEIRRQLQPALDYAREAEAQLRAYERSLPAGFEDMVRERTAALEMARSVFGDLPDRRTDFLPLHRRSETEELSGRIERLEKLLHERIPDPNAPVEPFPHKETGFHTTGQ